jgi:hypothetical protein
VKFVSLVTESYGKKIFIYSSHESQSIQGVIVQYMTLIYFHRIAVFFCENCVYCWNSKAILVENKVGFYVIVLLFKTFTMKETTHIVQEEIKNKIKQKLCIYWKICSVSNFYRTDNCSCWYQIDCVYVIWTVISVIGIPFQAWPVPDYFAL